MTSVDVAVIGAGPAGLLAALRAGDLGAKTALVTREKVGGMAGHDGPVPVRTLAHAARLVREARQLSSYGISGTDERLDYPRLLERVRAVVDEVAEHASLRAQIASAGIVVHEDAGAATFLDPHTIRTGNGVTVHADRFIICTGGQSRQLPVPGFELTATHSDAWRLTSVPATMLVVGGGATALQVASIFHAFGAKVELFERSPRILATEDEDVSAAMASCLRNGGMGVHEDFGTIDRFETTAGGVRMWFSKDGVSKSAEAALIVIAIGWVANTSALDLPKAGVAVTSRGFVRVDASLRTSAENVFAAGDVTGRIMLVPQALQDGFVAATNAVRGGGITIKDTVYPIGSFTDPEYAHVGMTEAEARKEHDVVVAVVRFDATTRTIIDGRTTGFLKLVVDRKTGFLLGCHVVGERAVDIVQTAAIAITAGMGVAALARVPLSFPTYTGALGRAAAIATRELNMDVQRSHFAELL
ncbi:MAG: NAD(P)/FAD-dependent oxidoreductase [Polyangiaceae bacterium]|nr:NAD(P)/FAD-dependent oxidoreductase [Polyangiaceae bacterium]